MQDASDDELEAGLLRTHARLCAVQAELLALIAEHDRRQVWRRFGATGEANHLVESLSVKWPTAQSWIRLAQGLVRHPRLAKVFADGTVSADQVGSLIDLADHPPAATEPEPVAPEPEGPGPEPKGAQPVAPEPDGRGGDVGSGGGDAEDTGGDGADDTGRDGAASHEQLLQLAHGLTAAQLARMARRARRHAQDQADDAHRRRRLHARRGVLDDRLTLDGVLFGEEAATVWSALDAYLDTCRANADTGVFDPLEHRFADALVAMAHAYLAGSRKAPRPTLVVHVDARVLLGEDGWAETTDWHPVAAETVRRLACHCTLTMVADGPDGRPVGVGRQQRLAPEWLADLVRYRDGGCRFPGCERKLFTQIHHLREWDAHQGRTDLPNLVELCHDHHHLLHEGRWRARGDPEGELCFTSPSGVTLSSRASSPPPDPGDVRAGAAQVRPSAPTLERIG